MGETLAMSASAEISPNWLPRSKVAPVALRLGFASEAPNGTPTPELSRIEIAIGRDIELHTTGLSSCSFAELYSRDTRPGHSCAKSLVGHGVVDSEIALPDKPSVSVEGHLLAFNVLKNGQHLILARVRTGAPLPLIYVIPFTIEQGDGVFGTELVVRKMRRILGICIHPNCFSPYTLKGIYSHISKLGLSLNRRFVHDGKADSFINARCPARQRGPNMALPLMRTRLTYSDGTVLSGNVLRPCKVRSLPKRPRQ
jgi:hypothetical protein